MTTQPTPSTVTASVSDPTPIPERPTLYAVLYPEGGEGKSWAIGSVWATQERGELRQSRVPGSVLVTIPGSAEQASKAKSKLDTAGFESAFAPAKEPDESTLYQKIGRAIRTADDEPTPTPKAEPKPKRGHVCDTRCMGDSGHHSWPAPRPDECLCNQELAGRPVFCPSCANKPKPDQSGDITDMIPWPKDLNELMGKRITTRLPLSGGVFVTDVRGLGVLSRHLETTNVADNSKHIIDASHRDLLSIEPKPADEGKVESPADTIARLTRERDEWKAKYESTGL